MISCEDDKGLCDAAIKAGIPVVSAEFILTGALRQDLDINSYPFNHNAFVSWVKIFRIIPEFRILRLTFHRKSASKY